MAKVKVKTLAVVNNEPIGSVVEVDEKEAKWLADKGYAEKVEVKSAKPSTKKAEPKAKSEASDKKDEE